jgi:hypothetical protein
MLNKFINRLTFLGDKMKENEGPNFTKGVHSILCLPLKSGFDLNLKSILEGKENAYWSDIEHNQESLFFNTYDDLKSYLSSKEWRQSWRAKVRVAVFFLGCSKEEAHSFFKQNKFSELVVRASHLDDMLVQTIPPKEIATPRFIENPRFNAYLLSPHSFQNT